MGRNYLSHIIRRYFKAHDTLHLKDNFIELETALWTNVYYILYL